MQAPNKQSKSLFRFLSTGGLNLGLFQQLIALGRSFFSFNEKFHIDLLLVFFITHCYQHEEKTHLFTTSTKEILLKQQKHVFIRES